MQFKQHPQVAKFATGANAKRVVALKDSNRDFPVGKGLAVVKWKLGSTNEAVVPLASEYQAFLIRVGVGRQEE